MQVERIEISIRRRLISLQFYLSLYMMDRNAKLIAILRRQYLIILTGLGEDSVLVLEYVFRIGLRHFATPTNAQYIFSQQAFNIMWYCHLCSQNDRN